MKLLYVISVVVSIFGLVWLYILLIGYHPEIENGINQYEVVVVDAKDMDEGVFVTFRTDMYLKSFISDAGIDIGDRLVVVGKENDDLFEVHRIYKHIQK